MALAFAGTHFEGFSGVLVSARFRLWACSWASLARSRSSLRRAFVICFSCLVFLLCVGGFADYPLLPLMNVLLNA